MADIDLQCRLDLLCATQNPDGGWGYFAGKKSWMEPTAYALLALLGDSHYSRHVERGWRYLVTLSEPDGSWRPAAAVQDTTWVAALGLLVACELGDSRALADRTVDWLLRITGAESALSVRLASFLHLIKTELSVSHPGWPWRPGTTAWVEPTALTIIALKKASAWRSGSNFLDRIRGGEDLILSRQDRDGGWNYGNPNVLSIDATSYPETTALAMLGLQGRRRRRVARPLELLHSYRDRYRSDVAQAWLTIALRCYHEPLPYTPMPFVAGNIMLTSLQALAHPQGNFGCLSCAAMP